MNILSKTICSIILAGLLTPIGTFAAGLDLVNIKTLPKTPGPNQEVKISIESYAIPVDSSEIIWYVNKEVRSQGIAEKNFSVRLGDFGQKTTVDIVIIPPDGVKVNKQIVLAPSEIDILWEAQTYTPPFYKGKALPSYKSLIRVSAIPRYNSLTSNPASFFYAWTYNRTQKIGSAIGKNSVVIPGGWADSSVPIAVDISLPLTDWKGYQNKDIHGTEAKVLLYENAPLLGIQYNKALSQSTTAVGNEFSVHAVPYFFSSDNYLNNELIYTWRENGSNILTGLDPMDLIVSKRGKSLESYGISLRVQNPKRILQQGSGQANIILPEEN